MNNKIQKELGNKLKTAREAAKLTQAEVAEQTDMTVNYYAMIERGEFNVTYDKLRKILKLLKMNPAELPL